MSTYTSSHGIESKKLKRPEEVTPVDTGLIRCICPSTEDDGFTIQCERCLVWQHAYCVHITHATIPEHYLCDQCSKRKRPKLSKRIPISKTKLRKLDSEDDPSFNKKKKHVKSRIVSRYVHPIFREAKERWSKWKQHEGHLLYDHGPFVTMDTTTLLTKGLLIDTPVSNQGIFATRNIPSLRYLMQVTGDVLLKSEFKFDPINDYVILGTPLSHIMFYPTLDLCIDTRQFGNKARYIRRSCHPNAELRNVVLPRDDKTIHLGLFARHLIEKGQEITISWGWQRGHIVWKENMNWHHQQKSKGQDNEGHKVIDEEEERRRKSTIKIMLDRFEKEFGSCACINKRRCLIEHLKRQISPPKEKPIFKLPAVNILPRRKSSVILLKPKSEIKLDSTKLKSGEESLDIDVTSNSPTLGAKETSDDDELVDVEGDIDIGDDLPTTKDTLPLLDDNSSDEENADLSSLSSLSSLSVFEESGNDNSDDDENRVKLRRKKHASRYSKSSRYRHHHHHHHHTASSSSSIPTSENHSSAVSNALPRKKLWMRDYLNKSIPDQPILSSDAQHMRQENTYLSIKHSTNYTNDTSNVNNSMDIDTKIQLFDSTNDRTLVDASPEDIEAAKLLLDAMAANEIPYIHRPETVPNFQIQPNHIQPTFDIDEGELSDASTILLDQDELREAYRRRSYDTMDNLVSHDKVSETVAVVENNVDSVAGASFAQESKSPVVPSESIVLTRIITKSIESKDDVSVNTIPIDSVSQDTSPSNASFTNVSLTNVSPPKNDISPTSTHITSISKSTILPTDVMSSSSIPSPGASPPKVDLSNVFPTNVSPINVNLTKLNSIEPITPSELTQQTKNESTEKKPIRKISLQEYLFKQQQQQQQQQQQKKMH